MKNIIFILKNWVHYKKWRLIINGEKPVDMVKGTGYYITVGLFMKNPIGTIEEVPMESGRIAMAELIDYDVFSDPTDMIKESRWHILGYKDDKPFKDMAFREYINSINIVNSN